MIQRTAEQIREHYEIERELAARLRNANAHQRRQLYTAVYDELLRRVPHHPYLMQKQSERLKKRSINQQMKLLRHFINENTSFLEIGAGNCALSLKVAERVKQVYAIDVSEEISKDVQKPENFQYLISDGSSIAVPEGIINIAYSNQLMEHLHHDDAMQQIKNIHKSLAEGGVYICITPNRINGPHDISKYFDDISTGLHLKEYTIQELYFLFYNVGFSRVKLFVGGKGTYVNFPIKIAITCEKLLDLLPIRPRKFLAKFLLFKTILGIKIIGVK